MSSNAPGPSKGVSKRKPATGKITAKTTRPKRTQKALNVTSDTEEDSPRKTGITGEVEATATNAPAGRKKDTKRTSMKSAAKSGATKKAITDTSRAIDAENDFTPAGESCPSTSQVKPAKTVHISELPGVSASRSSSSESGTFRDKPQCSSVSVSGTEGASSDSSVRHHSRSLSSSHRRRRKDYRSPSVTTPSNGTTKESEITSESSQGGRKGKDGGVRRRTSSSDSNKLNSKHRRRSRTPSTGSSEIHRRTSKRRRRSRSSSSSSSSGRKRKTKRCFSPNRSPGRRIPYKRVAKRQQPPSATENQVKTQRMAAMPIVSRSHSPVTMELKRATLASGKRQLRAAAAETRERDITAKKMKRTPATSRKGRSNAATARTREDDTTATKVFKRDTQTSRQRQANAPVGETREVSTTITKMKPAAQTSRKRQRTAATPEVGDDRTTKNVKRAPQTSLPRQASIATGETRDGGTRTTKMKPATRTSRKRQRTAATPETGDDTTTPKMNRTPDSAEGSLGALPVYFDIAIQTVDDHLDQDASEPPATEWHSDVAMTQTRDDCTPVPSQRLAKSLSDLSTASIDSEETPQATTAVTQEETTAEGNFGPSPATVITMGTRGDQSDQDASEPPAKTFVYRCMLM